MLRSAEDLGLFIGRRRWFGRPGEIVLRLPALDPAERDKAQARLNFWNQVCGCLPGGLAVLAATVWKAIALARAPAPGPAALAAAMATVLLLGIAAKIAALALARAMLVLEIGRLRRRLAAQADPPGE
ncbi:MAG TPA: hypothetical protein VE053_06375 [Allosphingosinicella sp.]|nr:hypothetical protein [Allosphingosinicella sp.]